jgi:hypothetical protein
VTDHHIPLGETQDRGWADTTQNKAREGRGIWARGLERNVDGTLTTSLGAAWEERTPSITEGNVVDMLDEFMLAEIMSNQDDER